MEYMIELYDSLQFNHAEASYTSYYEDKQETVFNDKQKLFIWFMDNYVPRWATGIVHTTSSLQSLYNNIISLSAANFSSTNSFSQKIQDKSLFDKPSLLQLLENDQGFFQKKNN